MRAKPPARTRTEPRVVIADSAIFERKDGSACWALHCSWRASCCCGRQVVLEKAACCAAIGWRGCRCRCRCMRSATARWRWHWPWPDTLVRPMRLPHRPKYMVARREEVYMKRKQSDWSPSRVSSLPWRERCRDLEIREASQSITKDWQSRVTTWQVKLWTHLTPKLKPDLAWHFSALPIANSGP